MRKPVELCKGSPVTIKSRTMFFYDEDIAKSKHCVSPQKYLPSTKIVENLRFTTIGFGIGGRSPNENTRKYNLYLYFYPCHYNFLIFIFRYFKNSWAWSL